MAKYDMCEMLYSVADGAVVPRRKSIVVPLLLTITGVALFVVNGVVDFADNSGNIKSALWLFGAIFAITGGIILVTRVAGVNKEPYCVKDGCFLVKKVLKFPKEEKNRVVDLVHKGDFATLQAIPQSDVSALQLFVYSSPKSGFAAYQVFEYVELELRPASNIKLSAK